MTGAKVHNSTTKNINASFIAGINNDIMDIEKALQAIKMKEKIATALKLHPYPIYHSEKSGWFTLVDDPNYKGGKRKIKKSTEEKLMNALVSLYLDKLKPTLAEIYGQWIEWKKTPTNSSNIERLETAWKSYFLTEPMSQELISKPMEDITSLELRTLAENLLKKHYPVDNKKFHRMFQVINECYEYAADEDRAIVPENLWQKAKKKVNKALIVPRKTPSDESQVFTDDDRRKIKEMVYSDMIEYNNRPTSAGLQILFMFETGLRIGECCGLKWSDVKNGRLYIQRQANNEGVNEWTKSTNGYRDIPLTKEAVRILEDVKRYNEEHNLTGEWIFQGVNVNYDGRLSYDAANNKLGKLCARLDIEKKTSHKIRKTTLSALLDSPNVNKRTVQRFAGHGDISTTDKYYNFDRRSKEEQAIAINEALSLEPV